MVPCTKWIFQTEFYDHVFPLSLRWEAQTGKGVDSIEACELVFIHVSAFITETVNIYQWTDREKPFSPRSQITPQILSATWDQVEEQHLG